MSEALTLMSDRANPLKGEVEIELGRERHLMRPTFAAIMEIEGELGGVVPLARRAAAGDFGLRELAVIICAGLNGYGARRFTREEVGEMILAAGIANAAAAVRDFLTNVLKGGTGHDGS